MSKGILGVGCSFTWGEGLYFYSELDNLPFKENHEFINSEVTQAMRSYKDKYRYLNLLSSALDTWYHSGAKNGGSQWLSNEYLKGGLFEDGYSYTDFKLLIYQFTLPERNFDRYETLDNQIIETDKILKKIENTGVKVITMCWDYQIPMFSEAYKKLFKHRHLDITYNGETRPYFHFLTKNDEYNLSIRSDFYKKGYQKNDEHWNKKGHKVISDLIIDKLKKDNFI